MIVYSKLDDYLAAKGMKYIDLQRALNLSPSMTAKFTKNRTMSTDTLNKVCEYCKSNHLKSWNGYLMQNMRKQMQKNWQ